LASGTLQNCLQWGTNCACCRERRTKLARMLMVSPLLTTTSVLLLLSSSLNKIPNYLTGKVALDERVIFVPTAANQINSTHWNVPIHGWIFEPENKSKKRKAFVKILETFFRVKNKEEKQILKRRVMPFVVDNQSLKFVNIKISGGSNNDDNKIHRMPRSAKDGHFFHDLMLHENELNPNKDGIVTFHTVDGVGDYACKDNENYNDSRAARIFTGHVHLIPPTGISIVSDIDDTVKTTNYLDKKELYKNTFIREFNVVPGMVELYQKLYNNKSSHSQQFSDDEINNCSFHYVSASPYQLFEELYKFLIEKEGFPYATFHLKKIRVKDKTLLELLSDPQDYKIRQIEMLLQKFPNRKFILVGDSGQKDIEVYIELYNKYPKQIHKIWIRNVNNATDDRFRGLLDNDNSNDIWQYYNVGTDIII
jgi:hypothetical protein